MADGYNLRSYAWLRLVVCDHDNILLLAVLAGLPFDQKLLCVRSYRAMDMARQEAQRFCGLLQKIPFLVTDNGPSLMAKRFYKHIECLHNHVRIRPGCSDAPATARHQRACWGADSNSAVDPSDAALGRLSPMPQGFLPRMSIDSPMGKNLTQNPTEILHSNCVPRHLNLSFGCLPE